MKIQLALKIAAMGFDGIKAQVERAGDVFVGPALDQQLQDLSFARGKQIVAILGAPDIDLSDVILSEDLADFRLKNALPSLTALIAWMRSLSAESFSR